MYIIISPDAFSTGNLTTMSRIQSHFSRAGTDLKCFSPEYFTKKVCPLQALNRYVMANRFHGVLVVHAFKSGKVLKCTCSLNCRPRFPYGLVFGGTDINIDIEDQAKVEVMKNCVMYSRFNICFTESLSEKSKPLFLNGRERNNKVYPQAVDYKLYKFVDVLAKMPFELPKGPIVFVLPCSIRKVKDPLLLLRCIAKLRYKLRLDVRLLIIGPVSNHDYYQLLVRSINEVLTSHEARISEVALHGAPLKLTDSDINVDYDDLTQQPYPSLQRSHLDDPIKSWMCTARGPFIQYLPPVDPKKFHAYMTGNVFFALVNSSTSEGMSSAVLEAMAVGIPVLVRNIPGNTSVVKHRENGFVFGNTDEFCRWAEFMIQTKSVRWDIIKNAKSTIKEYHNPKDEMEFYVSLLENKLQ